MQVGAAIYMYIYIEREMLYSTKQKNGDVSVPFHSGKMETVSVCAQSKMMNSVNGTIIEH